MLVDLQDDTGFPGFIDAYSFPCFRHKAIIKMSLPIDSGPLNVALTPARARPVISMDPIAAIKQEVAQPLIPAQGGQGLSRMASEAAN